MRRTQIQLDEPTYETLRRQAYQRGCSISAVVRALLAQSLSTPRAKRRASLKQFSFIGAGYSRQGESAPVSERHDEALAEALGQGQRR